LEGEPKRMRGAEREVRCLVQSTEFEVWLLSTENFSAAREHSPPEKLFATRYSPFAVHQSPVANRNSLPFWLGRNFALPIRPPTEVCVYKNEAC